MTVANLGLYYQMESWGHLYLSKFEFQGVRQTGCHAIPIYPYDACVDKIYRDLIMGHGLKGINVR